METETPSTVEVPTAETVAAATAAAVDSAVEAQNAEAVASAASVVAINAAAEVQAQIEDDEEWLERNLTEIRTEITSLKTQVTDLPQSLMATLSQQAGLIQTLTDRISELSIRATSSVVSQMPVTETPAQSAEVVPEDQRTALEQQPEKKRRKI